MEIKTRVEEFDLIISDLKKNVSFLEERVAKEELDKLVSFLVIGFCASSRYFLHLNFHGLLTRMRLNVIEKKKKQELLVRSRNLLFRQSLKKLGRAN